MKEQKEWERISKNIDCRSCQHYNNMRGRCHALTTCVLADHYKGKDFIQLWNTPKT